MDRPEAIDAARQRKAARVLETLRLLPAIDPATFGPAEWEIVRRKLGEATLSPTTQALIVAAWRQPAVTRASIAPSIAPAPKPKRPVQSPCDVCGLETVRDSRECSYSIGGRFVRVHPQCREAADRAHHPAWFGPCDECGLDARRFRLLDTDETGQSWCYEHYRQHRIAADVAAKAAAEAAWLVAARAGLQTRTVSDVTGTSTIAWGPADLVAAWATEQREWAESPTGRAYAGSVREWTERGVAHASVSAAASCE